MFLTRRTSHHAAARRPLTQHLRCALGADLNPLCRPLDRARSRALVLVVAGLGLSAALGAGAALVELGSAHHQAAESAGHRRSVGAVVLTAALPVAAVVLDSRSTGYQAQAGWTFPPGHPQIGTVDVPQGTEPGASTVLSVGDTGRIAAAPPTEADMVADAVGVGLLTLAALSMIAGAAFGGRRRCLDQRAANAWQHSWSAKEPVWSGRAPAAPDKTDA